MKKVLLVAIAFVGMNSFSYSSSVGAIQNADSLKTFKLNSEADSVSYAIGLTVGQSLRNFKVKGVDEIIVAKAIKDMLSNNPQNLQINEKEAMGIVQSYFGRIHREATENALKQGAEFLAKNKQEAGVVELPSGLQYKIINPGDLKLKPKAADTVVVHYTGSLIDGKVFDSSKNYGKPITFPLNQVIPGWTEGVQLIGKGGKVMLYIPSKLGYGENGAGNAIPGNSTLIFEIELLDVKVSNASVAQPKVAVPTKNVAPAKAAAHASKAKKK
ncbi:FKBP-type peptidyl-prolyl cis-trans isomerase [uncultured Acetobacteroides sp.]|uniref:FKBP-type peptidyl-prolyl cis-trans isomerase n=1 Tax=uncultured Acetobacteroides sp. TaxID=1760811 RepID=UPI0029F47BBD|nr:FKBP-type peptidyl-prolyl cis-trans isomerase [uncultured Acetobacteroides sp.]